MRAIAYVLFLLGMIALNSGCATTRGPKPLLTSEGSLVKSGTGVSGSFKSAEEKFSQNAASHADIKLARHMEEAGFALVYANCNDFFTSAGKSQKWIMFSRDLVGAVGTLATAVMALHGSSENAVSNAAFATAGSFAGMDIYTKNFLFSAENIDSVRELILKALDVHREAAGNQPDATYESVTLTLLDNQNICTPMAMTALVREAIKKGDVVASNDVNEALESVRSIQDEAVLSSLGRKLRPAGAVTMDEAGALYWLLKVGASTDKSKKAVSDKLGGFDSSSGPFDDKGKIKPDWDLRDAVRSDLNNFSSSTQQRFRNAIEAAVAAEKAPVAAPGAVAGGVASDSFAPKPTESRQSRRVSVGIRSN